MTGRECQHCTAPLHPKARYCPRCGQPAPPDHTSANTAVAKPPRTALQVVTRFLVLVVGIIMLSVTVIVIVTSCIHERRDRNFRIQAENAMRQSRVSTGTGVPAHSGLVTSVIAPTAGWSAPVNVPPGHGFSYRAPGKFYVRKDSGGEPILINGPAVALGALPGAIDFQSAESQPVTVTVTFSRPPHTRPVVVTPAPPAGGGGAGGDR